MDSKNHDVIVRMFYMVQLTETLIEASANEAAKRANKELKAAIIVYLYCCKMTEEAETAAMQLAWAMETVKFIHVLEDKTKAFNEAIKDWKG